MTNSCVQITLFLLIALSGCTGDGVPNVRYGKDACDSCRMIINDQRFAAAITLPSGDVQKFDEIRCLVDFLASHSGEPVRAWVRGYETNEWCRVEDVNFVHGPKLQTPMASGLAAVKSKDQAEQLARTWDGKTYRFEELADFLKNLSRSPSLDAFNSNESPPTILEESK